MCFFQDGRVLFSKAYALGPQLMEGQWEALFVSLACTRLLSDEENHILPSYGSQSHVPGT